MECPQSLLRWQQRFVVGSLLRYVGELLPEFWSTKGGDPEGKERRKQQGRMVTDLHSWLQCFAIYTAVLGPWEPHIHSSAGALGATYTQQCWGPGSHIYTAVLGPWEPHIHSSAGALGATYTQQCWGPGSHRYCSWYCFHYTFAYASAAIGIPLNARTSSAPPHQSTEQLPAGF